MDLPAPHRAEREALCDLMLELGPQAPTLCEGWTTADLAVHLMIREHDILAAPGIVLGGPFSSLLKAATGKMSRRPFEELVEEVRAGPPRLLQPFDRVINLLEFYVHHEDVRRGAGDTAPRSGSETAVLDDALWKLLGRAGRFLARSAGPVGLTLRRTGVSGDSEKTIRRGSPLAVMSGPPGELILYLTGRSRAANVELAGSEDAVQALRAADFGV